MGVWLDWEEDTREIGSTLQSWQEAERAAPTAEPEPVPVEAMG